MQINDHGGVLPQTESEAMRARNADLISLPPQVVGTNCGNCMYVRSTTRFKGIAIGMCIHPRVNQPVSSRMCCALWDAEGVIRDF